MKNLCNKNSPRASFQSLLARRFPAAIILLSVFSHFAFSATANEAAPPQKRTPQPQMSKPKPEGDKPQPWLSIDKTEHNFGEVFAGEELEHVFSVRNTGTAPLELLQGGPVGSLEQSAPERLFRTVSFTGSDRSSSGSFVFMPAMLAAPT